MKRRNFLKGFVASIIGIRLFLWFKKKKLFTAIEIVVGDAAPQGARWVTLKEWFRSWSGRKLGDEGSLYFWTSPDPNVTDAVEFGSRFRIAQDKGNVVIDHAGWSAVVPLSLGILHHVCYVWDGEGQHTVWLDGKEIKT